MDYFENFLNVNGGMAEHLALSALPFIKEVFKQSKGPLQLVINVGQNALLEKKRCINARKTKSSDLLKW